MTQEQLSENMGVQKALVRSIEKGRRLSITSMMRAFKAMGVPVALDLKGVGQVAL